MEKYVLTKSEIDAYPGIEKTHFLNANAKRVNKSLGDLTGLTGLGFHLVTIRPGDESTEFHRHYFEEECVYILSGCADAYIGDSVHKVAEGDFIGYRACGLAHKLVNTGTQDLACIVVGQRLDHDVADYPDKKQRIYRNKDMRWDLVPTESIVHPDAGKKV